MPNSNRTNTQIKKHDDGFSAEDIVLGGLKRDFDLEVIQHERGFHELEPLRLLIAGILAANQPKLGKVVRSQLEEKIVTLIAGKDGRGNAEKDDEEMLHWVAKRVFRKLYGYELKYGQPPKKTIPVKLRPIVRSLFEALGRKGLYKSSHSQESDIIRIERKFKTSEGYYLALSGLSSFRAEYLREFQQACTQLAKLGVATDFNSFQ